MFWIDPSLPKDEGNVTSYGGIYTDINECRNMAVGIGGAFVAEIVPVEGIKGWNVTEKT